MTDLATVYAQLARRTAADDLATAYRTALTEGQRHIRTDEPLGRPMGLLAAAVPRLTTLAVATHAFHVLPDVETREAALADDVLTTIEASAAGCLRRCHVALEADGQQRDYRADDWLPVVCDIAASAQRHASLADDPPVVVRCSQDAARWVAIAIDALDRDAPDATDALADALGCLLVVCVFADVAHHRPRGSRR